MKEDSVEIKGKVEIHASSLTVTDSKWVEGSPEKLKDLIDETREYHEKQLKALAKFDRERWKSLIKDKVVGDGWGHDRTMDLITDHFILEEAEEQWIEKWIEIFRKVRLDGIDVEKARKVIENDRDPKQRTMEELL